MPPLRDAATIAKFELAYKERTSGGVLWKRVPASEWVLRNLGCTNAAVDVLAYEHIIAGGTIYAIEESREEYLHHQYHYDFHVYVGNKKLYLETTLADSRMGPVVTVVNIHFAD
jgi:hypothetical protein